MTKDKKGLVHIYTGDGKGKTTCAVGLAVRASGAGLKVLFVQFFKVDGDDSGEKDVLRQSVPNVELVRSEVRHPFFTGNKTDVEAVRKSVRSLFDDVRRRSAQGFDLLVLDEVLGVLSEGFISIDEMLDFLDTRAEALEVVLTGRDAPVELTKMADYVTEMLKIKHPYDVGTGARRGIEF